MKRGDHFPGSGAACRDAVSEGARPQVGRSIEMEADRARLVRDPESNIFTRRSGRRSERDQNGKLVRRDYCCRECPLDGPCVVAITVTTDCAPGSDTSCRCVAIAWPGTHTLAVAVLAEIPLTGWQDVLSEPVGKIWGVATHGRQPARQLAEKEIRILLNYFSGIIRKVQNYIFYTYVGAASWRSVRTRT